MRDSRVGSNQRVIAGVHVPALSGVWPPQVRQLRVAAAPERGLKRRRYRPLESYRYRFLGGGVLHGKHFPERPHLPFADEEDAWEVAQKLQASTNSKEVVNIYVINAHDFTPVKGYGERKINKYPLYT